MWQWQPVDKTDRHNMEQKAQSSCVSKIGCNLSVFCKRYIQFDYFLVILPDWYRSAALIADRFCDSGKLIQVALLQPQSFRKIKDVVFCINK